MALEKTLAFLSDLSQHNTREWMEANKKTYLGAKDEFLLFVQQLIDGVGKFDSTISGLEAKKSIFRINRDIRFSANKDPYKNNMGASLAEGGRNSGNPVYYFHLQPGGESMLAGGLYMPEAETLKKIRQEIDYNPGDLKKIIEGKEFTKVFGALGGEKLKTAPKGYPKDHPNIELLRHKSFIVWRKLSDKEVTSAKAINQVLKEFELIYPFNQYLSVAIS